jgi:hypothetical protein
MAGGSDRRLKPRNVVNGAFGDNENQAEFGFRCAVGVGSYKVFDCGWPPVGLKTCTSTKMEIL